MFDRRTFIILGISVAIDYVTDVIGYSMTTAEGEGKDFELTFPSVELTGKILLTGIIAGLIFDGLTRVVERSAMSPEERALSDLVDYETDNIRLGLRQGVMPSAIQWTTASA